MTFAVSRSLTEQLGPLTAAASVYLIGGLFCLVYIVCGKDRIQHIKNLPRRYLWGCGTLFVLYMLFIFLAIGVASDRNQVLEIGLINYLWPALTILFSLFLFDCKTNLILLIPGTLFALLGIFLALTPDSPISLTSLLANIASNPIPYGLAMLAAIAWALYSNVTRLWACSQDGSGVSLFIPATGLILLFLSYVNGEDGSWTLRAGIEAIALGSATALAYVLWEIAMKKGDMVWVVACSYFTPFLSTLFGCLYLGIRAGIILWLGCASLIIGSFLTRYAVFDKPSEERVQS